MNTFSANTHKCSSSGLLNAATGIQLCDVQFMEAYVQYCWCSSPRLQTLCVEVCVSCWKPRLPCPCDPYVHCQRPCQGSGPYQFACSPYWLSLPDEGGDERRKEEGGECCLFVCLPALFYVEIFADHSTDWPRSVAVLCRPHWTPDSAMEATDFL